MLTTEPLKARIEVFRPGTFKPMVGEPISYSAADLRAIADAYDPEAAPAPVVVGHPETDAPAFGWVERFEYDQGAGRLYANLHQIDPTFADAVKGGRYKKVSMAFFSPEQGHNPVPGTWYPKHVGFLGAVAPAVSGLKPVKFSADAPAGAVFTAAFGEHGFEETASLLRSLRDFFIEKFGLEDTEKALPSYRIEWLGQMELDGMSRAPAFAGSTQSNPTTTQSEKEPAMIKAASADTKAMDDGGGAAVAISQLRAAIALHQAHMDGTEPTSDASQMRMMGMMKAALGALTGKAADPAFAAREADIADREGRISAREATLVHADNAAFAERLVSDGRLLPATKDKVVSLLDALPAETTVTFAEGAEKVGLLQAFRGVLEAQPKIVSFGRLDLPEGGDHAKTAAFAADGKPVDPAGIEIHNKALEYQRQHPGTDYLDAVRAVS